MIPAGYLEHERKSPLTAPWEPIYAKRTDRALQLAVEIRDVHCNSRGLAHGGLMAWWWAASRRRCKEEARALAAQLPRAPSHRVEPFLVQELPVDVFKKM